ncbi:MAG TPA: 3-oxoacyl-[acyl-carrier-protein] reductase [Dehalococcoidales bacterium]|nr:3-oxoacyl-[acyl-carrier-protein] reductase [Dehalococcoidales bacterium]
MKGKVALVTGSGRGIGKAIACRLAALNAVVVINDITDSEGTAAELRSQGYQSIFIKANIASTPEVDKMMEKVVADYGRIDILVNNAGITRDALAVRMSDEDWDTVINVNLKSVFICTRAALKYMMKQRYGRIINISSVTGIVGNPGQINYAAAKAGIIGMTRTVSKEMASRGITVNAICPGFIETDMTHKLSDVFKEEAKKRIPAGYFGTPQDVADAAAFFASDESRYITGQYLAVDGGMIAGW